MLTKDLKPQSAHIQLQDFQTRRPAEPGKVLTFLGVDGYDVYNTSIPFAHSGKRVIAGRVEKRGNEVSKTMFFEECNEGWRLISDAPVLDLQDPFVTFIGGKLFVGGVYVVWNGDVCVEYTTLIYSGSDLYHLKLTVTGPKNMKDVRISEMPDGRIAVFSRPQGEPMLKKYGCIAKIGFTIANRVEDITAELISNATLLEGQFLSDEWGGSNQIHNLKNGLLGVIAHKSWGEQVEDVYVIHYYSAAFVLDPVTLAQSPVKIIATRDCYPAGPQKNRRTADVTFTSGIIRLGNGKAQLYSGLNDCQEGTILINDPFAEFEK